MFGGHLTYLEESGMDEQWPVLGPGLPTYTSLTECNPTGHPSLAVVPGMEGSRPWSTPT